MGSSLSTSSLARTSSWTMSLLRRSHTKSPTTSEGPSDASEDPSHVLSRHALSDLAGVRGFSVAGCEKRHRTLGLCLEHYDRLRY
jgi:hypothetical protein